MHEAEFKKLKLEIQLAAKNGIDFIFAASIVWVLVYVIWTLQYTPYEKSIFTFIVGVILIPLAYGLSKIFKTNWKLKDNPLDSLGLWLNFAQLIYFPILVFILLKHPDYFIMAYAIITGAHLFPYTWYYEEIGYAISSIVISVGALLLSLCVEPEKMYIIPVFTATVFLLFGIWLLFNTKKLLKNMV